MDLVRVRVGYILAVLPYALAMNGGLPIACLDVRSWLLLAMLCIVQTGIAYIFYFGAMGKLPVHEVALLGYIEPVTSVLCSALVLHEPMGVMGALGAALVVFAAAAGELIRDGATTRRAAVSRLGLFSTPSRQARRTSRCRWGGPRRLWCQGSSGRAPGPRGRRQ